DGARVAHVFFQYYQHLPESSREHVQVPDGGVITLGGGEQGIEHSKGAGFVLGGDRVSEFVEGTLLGGEHHSLHIAESDLPVLAHIKTKLFELAADQHHVRAERID